MTVPATPWSPEPHRMSIHVRKVTKRFGHFLALDNVSLEVPDGELVALLGPSGSGKTTLLRIIAGMEVPDTGSVFYAGENVTDAPVRDRNVGFVFQHYALFRHMSVADNVAFGMRIRGWPADRVTARVRELLRLIQLEGLGQSRPAQLSGGQRQRVALARALAAEPKVLLLDEPFGALDARVREELRGWLRRLHDDLHVTSVFVTHDQEEAFEVADRVAILNQGHVEQIGSPEAIFQQPANPFVIDFLGNVNIFHGHVRRGRAVLGGLEVSYPQHPHDESRAATAFVRSHELEIVRAPGDRPSLPARVVHVNAARAVVKVRLYCQDFGVTLNVDLTPDRWAGLGLEVGETVWVSPTNVRLFMRDYAI